MKTGQVTICYPMDKETTHCSMPCPFRQLSVLKTAITVGSISCINCAYFHYDDEKNQIITCNFLCNKTK